MCFRNCKAYMVKDIRYNIVLIYISFLIFFFNLKEFGICLSQMAAKANQCSLLEKLQSLLLSILL